jgi:hypothetical protein
MCTSTGLIRLFGTAVCRVTMSRRNGVFSNVIAIQHGAEILLLKTAVLSLRFIGRRKAYFVKTAAGVSV